MDDRRNIFVGIYNTDEYKAGKTDISVYMLEVLKNINPEKLSGVKELQNALTVVLNLLEKVLEENTALKGKV